MCDEDGFNADRFQYDAPHVDPAGELLTLALLEDLATLLVVHGYPPLRGAALAELAVAVHHLGDDRR